MMMKVDVQGPNAFEGYNYLRNNSSLKGGDISWNFNKFLLNSKGEVHKDYNPRTHPDDIVPDIEQLLQS